MVSLTRSPRADSGLAAGRCGGSCVRQWTNWERPLASRQASFMQWLVMRRVRIEPNESTSCRGQNGQRCRAVRERVEMEEFVKTSAMTDDMWSSDPEQARESKT